MEYVKDLNDHSMAHQLYKCKGVCFKKTVGGVINSLSSGLGEASNKDPSFL